jgi:8-oxo-dGTP pyrophosphatase MutT (NUDIX family)
MPGPWEKRGEAARIFQNHIFGVDHEVRMSPRTGRAHDFYVLRCADWCNVVPITSDGQVVMVRQHRYGTGEETLELPGGMIDPGDPSPKDAAIRELLEETGYAPRGPVEPSGVIAANPAMQANRTWSFVARDVVRVAEQAPDAGEELAVVTVPLAEIPARIARGEITHALVVVAFAYALGLRTP